MLTITKVMENNFKGLSNDEKMLGEQIRETFDVKFDILDAKISSARTINFIMKHSASTALLVMVVENLERTIKLMEQFQNGCENYRDFYSRILQSGHATDEMDAIIKSSIEIGNHVTNLLSKEI